MIKTVIYKCDKCGKILVETLSPINHLIKCDQCNQTMRVLDDDFDLLEVIETEEQFMGITN